MNTIFIKNRNDKPNHSILGVTFFNVKHSIPKYDVICLIVFDRKSRTIATSAKKQPQKTYLVHSRGAPMTSK